MLRGVSHRSGPRGVKFQNVSSPMWVIVKGSCPEPRIPPGVLRGDTGSLTPPACPGTEAADESCKLPWWYGVAMLPAWLPGCETGVRVAPLLRGPTRSERYPTGGAGDDEQLL